MQGRTTCCLRIIEDHSRPRLSSMLLRTQWTALLSLDVACCTIQRNCWLRKWGTSALRGYICRRHLTCVSPIRSCCCSLRIENFCLSFLSWSISVLGDRVGVHCNNIFLFQWRVLSHAKLLFSPTWWWESVTHIKSRSLGLLVCWLHSEVEALSFLRDKCFETYAIRQRCLPLLLLPLLSERLRVLRFPECSTTA